MMQILRGVYVVSADRELRLEIERLLSAEGIYATAFEDADSYLSCHKPVVPSCLILDVSLRDLDCMQLGERLAGQGPPTLFVAGRDASTATLLPLDFMTSPLDPKRLLRDVYAALDRDACEFARREDMSVLRKRFGRLTPRELQVLPLILRGMLNKQVAAALSISEITVQVYRRRLMQKMGVDSFADLVRIAGKIA